MRDDGGGREERAAARRRQVLKSSLLLFVLTVQVLLPVMFFALRNRMIFLPMEIPDAATGLLSVGSPAELRAVEIRREDGRRLEAYESVHAEPGPRPTILFLHGNGGNIAGRAGLATALVRELDVELLMLDYSGYGGSEGEPTPTDVVIDAEAAYDYLIASGVAPDNLVLYGESLGGAVALALAARRPVAGVVTQSTFSSLSSMVRHVYPWMPLLSWLARDVLASDRLVGGLDVPLLVVHGDRDTLIPVNEARRLHRAAQEGSIGARAELLLIEGADHNNVFQKGGAEYIATLGRLCREWTTAPQ